MRNLTEENVTEAVISQLSNCKDPRLQEVMTSLVKHLHGWVREIQPTEEEWLKGIEFLTATGQKCTEERQEFILLSDTLGVSILVDAINHRAPKGATESSVLGPFYVEDAPMETGEDVDLVRNELGGEPLLFTGKVTGPDGAPIEGAVLDIWQTAGNGLYSNQEETQDKYNMRGRIKTDKDGNYRFRTCRPRAYEIPTDGPVGAMVKSVGRHCYRPAHVHFIVTAEGYEPVTTMIFADDDPYIDSDVVFAVKNSLVVKMDKAADGNVYTAEYDFGLKPAA